MEFAKPLSHDETIEQGIARLRDVCASRDRMCGDLYFNVLNDDACELASQLSKRGADRDLLHDILGHKNATR